MNARERILAAIAHKEPDRIPLDIGATPSTGISVVAYKNLLKFIGKEHWRTEVYDVIQEVVQPGSEFLDYYGVDVVDVGRNFNQDQGYWHELEIIKGYPAFYPHWFNPKPQKDGSWLAHNTNREVVGRMPAGATFFDQTIFPYLDNFPADYTDLNNAMGRVIWGSFGFTPFDWMDHPKFWEILREKTLELKKKTNKALIIGVGCNLFEWGTFLRRLDNFLMDLFLNPDEVHRLLDALLERHLDFLSKVCTAIGDVVDIIKFGDDLGTNNGPFMPPETYREFFLPRHKQMCSFVKERTNMTTMLHSCGGIYELIPGLIEAGFEILNPVQISAVNMEPWRLKKEFGRDLTFWGGGVDTKSVLNLATPSQVKESVKQNLEVFAKDGGYVFNTVHNILPDVPPENIVAMLEAVNEFTM